MKSLNRTTIIRLAAGVLVVALLVTAAVFLVKYLSERTVTITLSAATQSVVIQSASESECEDDCSYAVNITLNASGTVRLPDGDYLVLPTGDTISSESLPITVTKDTTTFSIDPEYSQEYLESLLEKELAPTNAALMAAYPLLQQYNIAEGTLYKHADWYVTSLVPPATDGSSVDIYYAILHKVDGQWQVATTPSLYFTYAQYPDIPKELLYSVNAGSE